MSRRDTADGKPVKSNLSSTRMAMLLAVGIFIVALSISSLFARSLQEQNSIDHRIRLTQEAATLQSYANSATEGYGRLILSAAALLAVQPDTSAEDWRRFYASSQAEANFSKIVGLGYVGVTTDDSPDASNERAVIKYLTPNSEENIRAIGFDMYSEPTRRSTMIEARDTGRLAMTPPVQLVQDHGVRDVKGELIYYPVYRTDTTPKTVEERRRSLQGYVYVVFRPNDMMKRFVEEQLDIPDVIMCVRDVTNPNGPIDLYRSGDTEKADASETETLQFAGRTWQFEVSGIDSYARRLGPVVLFLLGAIVSLGIASTIYRVFAGRIRRIATVYEDEVQRTKDELLALTSHQLRTPASGVKQYIGILTSGIVGELTPDQKTIAEKAYDANERQLQIINELLYVSKADAGQLVLEPNRFNMTRLVQQRVDDFAEQASQKDVTIKYETKKPYYVTADDRYVAMAVENLISNAIKYSYQSSTVKISLSSDRDQLKLKVRDRGVGVSDEDSERIFEKFSRVDNPLSHTEGGSGLGLFLARQLARAHGGDITVEGKLDKGSMFTLSLPKRLTINEAIVRLNKPKEES